MKRGLLILCLLLLSFQLWSCRKSPRQIQPRYRNILSEIGVSEADIDARIKQCVQQFFYGNPAQRLYYEVADDMAYFLDVANNDIRSEGVSYGMMFCVQLNMKPEFDRLWKFAYEKMLYKQGDLKGYFAWQLSPVDFSVIGKVPAPDGEEYFAMALLFASKRWGDGGGILNYRAQANNILDHMIRHREILGLPSGSWASEMINPDSKMVVFVPYGEAARFSDPSYHLPHFYELWALWADANNDKWHEIAQVSRAYFQKVTHPRTGLAPDYAYFDGIPVKMQNHYRFEYDAWRVAMNIALDSQWWNRDPWQRKVWVKKYLGFFRSQGIGSYKSCYDIDGSNAAGSHATGLVSMNAIAALIADKKTGHEFVRDFWSAPIPSGTYRYFDGCLYLFALLNTSGRYTVIDTESAR